MDPKEWRKAIETRLNELLDQSFALITALDCMEADCDLEDDGDQRKLARLADRARAIRSARITPTANGTTPTTSRGWPRRSCPDFAAKSVGARASSDDGEISDGDDEPDDSGIADLDALHVMSQTAGTE